jgi:transcription-repair coupling factor (superfamily II helicase)
MSNLNFFSFPNIFTTIEDSKKPILLSNINIDSGALFFYFLFQQNNKDLLLVVKDNTQVDTIYNLFKILNKDLLVLKFKDLDSEPYSKTLSSRDLEANNINTLIKSLTLKEKKIVITSSLGYIQKTLPINELQNNLESLHINLKLKDVLPRDVFINKLIQLGYEKKPLVLKVGDFALRGDIIDIFPNYENPIRLSFFDDELENIKFFDKETQLSLNNVETFTIYRVKNIILNQNLINREDKTFKLSNSGKILADAIASDLMC